MQDVHKHEFISRRANMQPPAIVLCIKVLAGGSVWAWLFWWA